MKPRHKQPAATRAALLDAASAAFSRHGYHATGTAPLVAAAGLTKGALFHHYPDKPSIATAWVAERLTPAIEQDWIHPLSLLNSPANLRQLCRTQLATPDPLSPLTTLTALTAELANSEPAPAAALENLFASLRNAIADLLQRGKSSSLVHPSVDPQAEATLLLALISGLTVTATTPDLRRGALNAMDAYFETLKAPGT